MSFWRDSLNDCFPAPSVIGCDAAAIQVSDSVASSPPQLLITPYASFFVRQNVDVHNHSFLTPSLPRIKLADYYIFLIERFSALCCE